MKKCASTTLPPLAPRLASQSRRARQNLPGYKLAKAGTQVTRAGTSCPGKFSRCQQVPDIVSYCHVWSALREKYFCIRPPETPAPSPSSTLNLELLTLNSITPDRSTRRPGKRSAAEDVAVQVRDGFAGMRAVVEHET